MRKSVIVLLLLAACTDPPEEVGGVGDAIVPDVTQPSPDTGPAGVDIAVDTPAAPDKDIDTLLGPCLLLGVSEAEALSGDALLLSTLLPRTGPLAIYGLPMDRAVAMAVAEINGEGGIGGRKLGMLSCDSQGDSQVTTFTVTHLVEQGIAAVIGAATSFATMDAFTNVAKAGGLLMISPSATSPAITHFQDDGLLWRTAISNGVEAHAMSAHLLATGAKRVALVHANDVFGNGMREAFESHWCPKNDCENDYLPRPYNEQGRNIDQELALDAIEVFEPDAILVIGFSEPIANFVNQAHERGIVKLLLNHAARDPVFLSLIKYTDLLCHSLGVYAVEDPEGPAAGAFLSAYEAKWSEPAGVFTANAYDATYALAYAAATLGDTSVTGTALAQGLTKLTKGIKVVVGAAAFAGTSSALVSGNAPSIDLEGASSSLNFNPETGEPAGKVHAYHFATGVTLDAGLIYDEAGVYQAPQPGPPCQSQP